MSSETPKISVLMSVYNGERYLREAIESILQQTFEDFEFIIIDDASTDSSRKIIESYHDPRIRLIINEKNIGLTRSLNRGIGTARTKLIARQDADDASSPERLEHQFEYFNSNPDTALLGCSVYFMDENSRVTGRRKIAADPSESHFQGGGLAHGTAMFSKEKVAVLGGYNELFRYCQDLDLWLRIAKTGKVRGLPAYLYKLRLHTSSIQFQKRKEAALYHLLAVRSDARGLDHDVASVIRESGILSFYPLLNKDEKTYFHESMAYSEVFHGNFGSARSQYLEALKTNPLAITNYFYFLLACLGPPGWSIASSVNRFIHPE